MSSNVDHHRQALAADPDDRRAFEALQEHHFLEGEWPDLIELYRTRLSAPALADDPAARAQLMFRMAQVLEERCDRIAEAEETYWEVARLEPQFRPALRQLRHIYASRAQWDMVLQTAELEGQIPMPASDRAAYLADLGEVWLTHLDDPAEAQRCFESALEGDPHQQKALHGLARTHLHFGRHQKSAEIYERLVAQLRGPERAPVLVALGKVYAGVLNKTDSATTCFRRAMTDDPRNEDAVESLVVIASAEERWPLLADLYERRFDLASGARQRATIAVEAGTMHLERLQDRVTARTWFDRARELVDDDPAIHSAVAELERAEGHTTALRMALDRVIGLGTDAAPASILLEAADLHTDDGDSDTALRYLQIAHERKPDDPLVVEALSDALSTTGRTADLAEILERRAALATDDPDIQAEALLELGRIHEEDLGDAEAALDALTRAFEANPANPEVTAGLERLFRKTERWEDLREVLEQALARAPQSEHARLASELGSVLADHIGDDDGAMRAYGAALDANPHDVAALAGLERVARRTGDTDTLLRVGETEAALTEDADRLATLADELIPLLEGRHAPERALALVSRLLESRPDDLRTLHTAARLQEQLGLATERLATLQRLDGGLEGRERAENCRAIADLKRAAGDAEGAIASLEAAAECDPNDIDSLRTLIDHYEGAGRIQDVARVQRRLVDALPPEDRADALTRLATMLEVQLADADGAIVVLWRLLEQPDHPADAVDRLESLLERTGRFADLAQRLAERRRSLPDHDGESVTLDLRRARLLLDQLGQLEDAAALYGTILERHPSCSEASEGLEEALRSSHDSEGLAALLESRARTEQDPSARAHLELERAMLLEESIGDEDAALALLLQLATSRDEPSVAALADERILRLLERRGDWPALRERIETSLGAGSDADDLELHGRLAAICRDRIGDRDGCILHLEAIGKLDPARSDVWSDLAPLYEEQGREGDMLRVMQAELANEPEPDRALVLHTRAARVHAGREDDGDAALARNHYEQVLALDATHSEASEYLIDAYTIEDRPEDVAQLLDDRLAGLATAQTGEVAERLDLELRLASLRAERLGDRDGATRLLEGALQRGEAAATIATPLASLYEDAGNDEALIALCRRAAAETDVADERARWTTQLADALTRSGHPAEAAEAWCAVLVDRPGDRDIEAALRDLYRELDEPAALAALLEAEIPRAERSDAIALRVEIAELLAERLERGEDALDHLRQALEADGTNDDAYRLAIALSEALGRQDDILALIDARLDATPANAERARLLERRGDLLSSALDRPEEAASAYREAVALANRPGSARQSLRAVMERLERWPAVLDCLHLEAQDAAADDRVGVLERAVEIAREHISLDATLPWLERLRAERPDDPTVLAQMAEVHRQAGRPEALLRAIEQETALVDDDARRRDLHVDRARILERDLSAPGRAVQAFETARALAPDDREILAELDRLYDVVGRAGDRVDVIERRITLEDECERIELHRQAALLHVAVHADPERGIPHLLHALALCKTIRGGDQRRASLLRELAGILRGAGRIDAWARAAEAELDDLDLDSASGRQRAGELHLELGRAYDRELGLPDAGVQHLRALLALVETAGSHPPISLPDETMRRAEQMLIDRLRAQRSHHELAERLAARLARGAAPSGATEVWLELARLRLEQLHAPAAAAEAFREVLARQPGHLAAIRGLRHVAEVLCNWSEVAHTIELELAAPERGSPHDLAALHRRLGDVCRHRLNALERAADAYAAALEARPGDIEILRALQTLHEQRGRLGEAVDAFEREIELLGDDDAERRHELWLRVAGIARDELDDPGRALRAYERARTLAALAPNDQRALAELHQQQGNSRQYAEAFAVWCDDDASGATAWDHLALVSAERELGEAEAALRRARRAAEIDPQNAEAWDVTAELLEAAGDRRDAAAALEHAAGLQGAKQAALRLVAAAELTDPGDADEIARRLRGALDADPGLAAAHAALAVVAERLDEDDEATRAAGRAIDLADLEDGLSRETKLECALVGGRCARAAGDLESAARFLAVALELDPRHREALDAACEVAFAQSEFAEAQRLAAARLDLGGEHPQRARLIGLVAHGLERAGDTSAAVARYREALERDAGLTLAHEGLVRIHEDADNAERVLTALERWIDHDDDACHRATLRVRAAERLAAARQTEAAERHLRAAVSDDEALDDGWTRLVELLAENERDDEVLDVSARALSHVQGDAARARIALVRARLLDTRGHARQAAEAYGEVTRRDPRSVEAALAEARLLRGMGDWNASAESISRFVREHPEPDSVELAQVHLEWGRLASGPLEDVAQAIRCYERALVLCPSLVEAREPLAALLAHVPDRWRDAVDGHRALLADQPTRGASLRSLLEISRRRDLDVATGLGLSILRALGSASPSEASQAPHELGATIGRGRRMAEPTWEVARCICVAAADEIAEALASAEPDEPAPLSSSPGAHVEAALQRYQGELSVRGLERLDAETLGSLVFTVTALAADPGGNCNDGPYRHALDEGLGRWVRRKIRRTLGDLAVRDIQSIDYEAWRGDLRVMAACVALDAREIDLRSALLALARDPEDEASWPADSADLSSLVSASPAASALLGRAVDVWCDAILGTRS